MMVVAIVGILAVIAIPAYRSYVLKGNRIDAIRVLTGNAQILQRCYSQYFAFNNANCPALPTSSPNAHYTIANATAASTYTLTATATGSQTADSTCNKFKIDQTGKQSAVDSSNNDQTAACWGSN
jgi:type IV pilus assembly protein PilE